MQHVEDAGLAPWLWNTVSNGGVEHYVEAAKAQSEHQAASECYSPLWSTTQHGKAAREHGGAEHGHEAAAMGDAGYAAAEHAQQMAERHGRKEPTHPEETEAKRGANVR